MTLPLNVFVTDAKREKVVTDKVKVDVDVAVEAHRLFLSFVRTITFTMPEGSRPAEFEVYAASTAPLPAPASYRFPSPPSR